MVNIDVSDVDYAEILIRSILRNPHDPLRGVAAYLKNLPPDEATVAAKELRRMAFQYFSYKGMTEHIERYDLP